MMRTRAAVAVEAGKPLEIMEVNLDGPRKGEVLVEIKATGLCHTDEFTRSGDDPEGIFPAILGHEGAGVVIEVGEGVTTLEVGDHVGNGRQGLYWVDLRTEMTHFDRNAWNGVYLSHNPSLMPH